jgi:hypothetical protein
VDLESGEYDNRRLEHKGGGAEQFYRSLAGQQVRVGLEATGGTRWFERLLGELKVELWVGDPVKVRAAAGRKPKTDKRDAELLLRLLLENRFPRNWVPTVEQRDARQLVLHRRGRSHRALPSGLVVDVEVGTQLRADQKRVPFACRVARVAQWGWFHPRRREGALPPLMNKGV